MVCITLTECMDMATALMEWVITLTGTVLLDMVTDDTVLFHMEASIIPADIIILMIITVLLQQAIPTMALAHQPAEVIALVHQPHRHHLCHVPLMMKYL